MGNQGGHRWYRRVLVGAALALLAPLLPVPTFSFEPVAAAEPAAEPDYRPADSSDVELIEQLGETAIADRVVTRESEIEEFTTIGVTLDAMPSAPIMVRVFAEASWGDWQEAEVERHEGPDLGAEEANPQVASEPLWVKSATGFEMSIDRSDVGIAQVMLVREQNRRVVLEEAEAGAAVALSGMRPRGSWGARAPKVGAEYAKSVDRIVVHHSASSNAYGPADVPGALRGIQAYHMDARGWNDIGYNFVVDRFGGIWEARGGGMHLPVIGAHAAGHNTGSSGVMVLGEYTNATPTAASLEGVSHVTGWKLAFHGRDPVGRVVGHRDVGSTACPGSIHSRLGSIAARASDYFKYYKTINGPKGKMESVVAGAGSVTIRGWAIDPTSSGAASVRLAAGSAKATQQTSLARPDISVVHGGNGYAGFSRTLTGVPPGMQSACARVYSSSGAAGDLRLGCQWVLVTDPTGTSPVGRFDSVVATPGQIHAAGWGLDPETSSPIAVDLLVDGTLRAKVTASSGSSSIPATHADLGRSHGYKAKAIAVPAGTHHVCARGRNIGNGVDTLMDCRYVTVPAHNPGGVLETVSSSRPGKIDITGWGLDLESTRPIDVLLVVDGRWHVVPANKRRADVGAAYPGYGEGHGFAATVNAKSGRRQVCAYGINVGGGSNSLIGCKTVNVVK